MSDLDELKAEWFEFGRKSGIKEEQERVIKLLLNENQCPENNCNEVQCLLTRLLISLIKQKNVVELIKGEK